MKKLITLILALLPCFLLAQDNLVHYKIYDVKKQKTIVIDDIVKDFAQAQVLFFGEEHNDSIGHYLEDVLFAKLCTAYPGKMALTLEMFHTDIQPVIDEYLAGIINEKNLIKEARAWNNYKDYRPMVELAKQLKLPVVAGNAAARYSNAVTRNGITILDKLSAQSKKFLPPLPIDTATGRYYEKFIETLGGHNMGGMKIYQSQNLWDATMAWSITKQLQSQKGSKVFQVNGRFHSDEKLGTFARLKKLSPKSMLLSISSFSAEDFEKPDWNKYLSLADYIILTDPKVKKTF